MNITSTDQPVHVPNFGSLSRDEDGEYCGQEAEPAHQSANSARILLSFRLVKFPWIMLFEASQERFQSCCDVFGILRGT